MTRITLTVQWLYGNISWWYRLESKNHFVERSISGPAFTALYDRLMSNAVKTKMYPPHIGSNLQALSTGFEMGW